MINVALVFVVLRLTGASLPSDPSNDSSEHLNHSVVVAVEPEQEPDVVQRLADAAAYMQQHVHATASTSNSSSSSSSNSSSAFPAASPTVAVAVCEQEVATPAAANVLPPGYWRTMSRRPPWRRGVLSSVHPYRTPHQPDHAPPPHMLAARSLAIGNLSQHRPPGSSNDDAVPEQNACPVTLSDWPEDARSGLSSLTPSDWEDDDYQAWEAEYNATMPAILASVDVAEQAAIFASVDVADDSWRDAAWHD